MFVFSLGVAYLLGRNLSILMALSAQHPLGRLANGIYTCGFPGGFRPTGDIGNRLVSGYGFTESFSPNSVFNTWGSYGSSKRPGG